MDRPVLVLTWNVPGSHGLNEQPGGRAIGHVTTARWRDAWAVVHGDGGGGATNRAGGDRARRPATPRIDDVLVPAGWHVEQAAVIAGADQVDHVAEMGELSDHLPLVVAATSPQGGRS